MASDSPRCASCFIIAMNFPFLDKDSYHESYNGVYSFLQIKVAHKVTARGIELAGDLPMYTHGVARSIGKVMFGAGLGF